MKYRCKTSRSAGTYYSARGIRVCEEWQTFLPFFDWSIGHGYKQGLTIDRINNNGNYEPNNCRFTTYSIQNMNRRKPVRMPR